MDTSNENLEAILAQFAEMICKRHGIVFRNGEYKIVLEEEMLSDMIIEAGNPVIIKFHWRILAEGLKKRNMTIVKHQLQHALEMGSKRMLHTLSQNPAAPAIIKNVEDKRWTKITQPAKQFPTLLPDSRLNITTHLTVTVQDKVTGEMWTEKGYAHKVSIGELERKAVKELSKVLLTRESHGDEGKEVGIAEIPNQSGTEVGNDSGERPSAAQ